MTADAPRRHLDDARADQERRARERVGVFALLLLVAFLLFGLPLAIRLWTWAV